MLIITFGLIEFSMVYQSSSTGAGAAALGRTHRLRRSEAPELRDRCRGGGGDRAQDRRIDEPVEMWVYKANACGYPGGVGAPVSRRARPTASSMHGSPRPKRSTSPTPPAAVGPTTTQQACDVVNWDSVGVYIKLNHKYLTKLFGDIITLTDHAVFRLEPAPDAAVRVAAVDRPLHPPGPRTVRSGARLLHGVDGA